MILVRMTSDMAGTSAFDTRADAGIGLADFRRTLDDFFKTPADFGVGELFRGCRLGAKAAEFGRGNSGFGLEGAVERAERLETGVERDGQDRHLGLARVRQRGDRLGEAVAVDEAGEVAMPEALVDQPPQPVFRDAQALGEHGDAEALLAINPLG